MPAPTLNVVNNALCLLLVPPNLLQRVALQPSTLICKLCAMPDEGNGFHNSLMAPTLEPRLKPLFVLLPILYLIIKFLFGVNIMSHATCFTPL